MFLGLLGLDRETMNETRAGDLYTRLYWYNRTREEDKLEQFRLMRLQTFELINIQLQKKDKLKKPSQLWRLPGEEDERKVNLEGRTQEQIDYLVNLMNIVINGNNSKPQDGVYS